MTLRPTTLAELTELISTSATRAAPLRIIGRGTWLEGGAPVRADAEPVHLAAFSGVIEYEPGDLTITVGAATTIAELDAVTAAHNQWCPLAPWGGDDGSVGATIATSTAGPFASALGLPRDLVLGLECVDGTGKVLRPGGKVVKNVAGFDLTRLMTGAWGSLGALTRMSLRLRARPLMDETWAVPLDAADVARAERIGAFVRSHTPPVACEQLDAELASHVGLERQAHVLVRLAGNAAFVGAARTAMSALGTAAHADASIWTALRAAPRPAAVRLAMSPGERALNERIKHAFDPANILNPGIMG